MELINGKGLQFMMDCIIERKDHLKASIIYQRALEILSQLLSESKARDYIKQNYLFIHDVEKLLSASEESLQQVAQIFLERLKTNPNSTDIPVKQIENRNTTNDLAIFKNNEIFISYSPDDRDLCYQITDRLLNDKIRVNMRFDILRRLTTEKHLNLIENPKVKHKPHS